jgi:xanthine/CO dehydrogenase XdhC/CoxF family maturation factor
MTELAALITHLTDYQRGPAVLATLVAVAGSSYRRPGARLIVTANGQRLGSISGGCLEEDVLLRARIVAATGQAELVTYDTSSENDLVWGVGLGCHGIVQVLLEPIPSPAPAWVQTLATQLAARRPTPLAVTWRSTDPRQPLGTQLAPTEPSSAQSHASKPAPTSEVFLEIITPAPSLIIFGAGDDAQPLAQLAHTLSWHVTIADPRATFANVARFPTAERLIVAPANELVARVAPEPEACVVVMTHHYVHDVPILRSLLSYDFPYIGLLGPKKRAARILADLARDGFVPTPARIARFHAPIGLDLGADAPADVALSILAEIRALRSGRDARPLRDRTRPIHD